MKKFKFLLISLSLILALSALIPTKPVQAGVIPTFSIVSVEKDATVTILTYNFPVNKNFKVLMGEFGTMGIGGLEAASINTGLGGSFYVTLPIPALLYGRELIAIRLQGVDTAYYAYNWFTNDPGGDPVVDPDYYGIPTFYIEAVEKDTSVTIKTHNFPKNMDFKVLMGYYGTKGVNGIYVETINSGTGGEFEATYAIPAELAGQWKIAIRLESTTGYYAYNWFFNNSTTVPVVDPIGPIPGYTGYPTFLISAVQQDNTVTISGQNFPPGVQFNVLMGKMWTAGINGIYVTTIDSGAGGSFSQTFTVPPALYGNNRIAVRLQSVSTGYYAYNWFWNNTYP